MVIIVIVIVIIIIVVIILSILLAILVISFIILILFIFVIRSLLVRIFALICSCLLIITPFEPLVKNKVGLVHLLSEHHTEGKEGIILDLVLVIHVGLHVSLSLGEFTFMFLRINAHSKLGKKLVLEE
jgi:hypothetical protein